MRRTAPILAAILALAVALVLWTSRGAIRPAGNAPIAPDRGPGYIGSPDGDVEWDPALRGSASPESEAEAAARRTRRPSLSGIVRRAGRPIAARVEAYPLARVPAGTPSRWSSPAVWTRAMDPVAEVAPAARSQSGADGAYRFASLPKGLYRLAAVASDGARGTTTVEVVGEGTIARDLAVPVGGHSLKGVVKDAAGNAWRGGLRAVHALDDEGVMAQHVGDAPLAPTDEAGRFTIVGLDAGRYSVQAIVPGSLRVDVPNVWVPAEKELEIVVGAGMHVLPGRVLVDDTGAPIEGAVVVTGTTGLRSRATSDAAGRFEVLVSDTEKTWFHARAEGFGLAANYEPKASKELVIRLSRSGKIMGRVVARGDGSPVAGVTVLATQVGGNLSDERGSSAVSGPDGHYALDDVPAAEVLLAIRSGGYVLAAAAGRTGPTTTVTVPRGGTTVVDLAVDSGVAIRGHVKSAAGTAMVGARVEAFLDDSKEGWPGFRVSLASASTDGDGGFELTGLALGHAHEVTATARGHFIGTATVTPNPETTEPLEITLADPAGVDVRVVGDEGEALAIAEVSSGGEVTAVGPDGVAHLHWVMKESIVRVAAPGRRDFEQTLGEPDASGSMAEVVARMQAVFPLAGRVTYADGTPAPEVWIQYDDDGRSMQLAPDADGTFRLPSLAAGEQTFTVRDPRHPARESLDDEEEGGTVRVTARAGDENVRVVLPWKAPPPSPPGPPTILVRVTDSGGVVVPFAKVLCVMAKENRSYVENVEGGIANVTIGFSSLFVSDARSSSGARLPLGSRTQGPAPAGATEVEVRLPRERRVSGTVVDASGRPVEGCVVSAQSPGSSDSVEARTDALGRFSVGSLGEGGPTLSAAPPASFLPLAGIDAAEGATDVVLRLSPAVRVVVTVLDEKGAPVSPARVGLYAFRDGRRAGYLRSETTDVRGRAVLEGLDPAARFIFEADAPGAGLLQTEIVDALPEDRTLVLHRALSISGLVRDRAGAPVAKAAVLVRQAPADKPTGGTQWAIADANGRFEASGLAPGPYALRVGWDPSQSLGVTFTPEVAAVAGASDVDLVVDSGLPLVVRVVGYPKDRAAADVQLCLAANSTEAGADGDAAAGRTWSGTPDEAGVVRFEHAPPDARYTLSVGPLPGRLCALVTGVRPGRDEVVVHLERGEPIRGTLTSSGGFGQTNVRAFREGIWWTARVDDRGGFLFPALVPGRYHVEAMTYERAEGDVPVYTVLSGSADVETGSTPEIPLAAPK